MVDNARDNMVVLKAFYAFILWTNFILLSMHNPYIISWDPKVIMFVVSRTGWYGNCILAL